MAPRHPSRTPVVALACVSVLALYLGFASNFWGTADHDWFTGFQRDSEGLVIGRLVQSRQAGVFSHAGLMGRGDLDPGATSLFSSVDFDYPYRAYETGRTFTTFTEYKSQIGGQAFILSLLDRALPASPRTKLDLFHSTNALLLALVLTAVIVWFHLEYGALAASFVLAGALSSQWLTVFGRNLLWSMWSFFVPMATMLWLGRRGPAWSAIRPVHLGALALAGMLLKCLFSGYDYITTTVVMMAVPIVHLGVRDRLEPRRIATGVVAATAGAAAAIALAALVLCVQIAIVDGSAAAGLDHIASRFYHRTYRSPEVWQTGVVPILGTYLRGIFVEVEWPHRLIGSVLPGLQSGYSVRYWHLFVAFAAASALTIAPRDRTPGPDGFARVALVAAAWLSMLAPLSFLFVFRGHSIVHTHQNFVVWQMPFTLYGFAVCGLAAGMITDGAERWKRRLKRA